MDNLHSLIAMRVNSNLEKFSSPCIVIFSSEIPLISFIWSQIFLKCKYLGLEALLRLKFNVVHVWEWWTSSKWIGWWSGLFFRGVLSKYFRENQHIYMYIYIYTHIYSIDLCYIYSINTHTHRDILYIIRNRETEIDLF